MLAKQHPLQQTQSALLANEASYMAKLKELTDIDNQISEEKSKFNQALNSLVSIAEQWKIEHVLSAPQAGAVIYAGIIQENQHVDVGSQVFLVDPGDSHFFGEATIPQYNMGKVKHGQDVLIKLNSYPFEEYSAILGTVERINHVPVQDSIFLSKVVIHPESMKNGVKLTTGMLGTAEIITEDASLLQRLARNVRAVLHRQQ